MTRPVVDQVHDCFDILKIAGDSARDDDVMDAVLKFLDAEVAWLRANSDATPELQQKGAAVLLGRVLAITAASCLQAMVEGDVAEWLDRQAETFTFADLVRRLDPKGPTGG